MNLPLNDSGAGAFNLLYLLQEIIDFWHEVDPRFVLVFEVVVEAIFLHDLTECHKYPKPDLEINFEKHSLAIILIVADEIQCWGRPRLNPRPGRGPNDLELTFDPERESVSYELRGRTKNGVKIVLENKAYCNISKLTDGGKRLDLAKFIDIEALSKWSPRRTICLERICSIWDQSRLSTRPPQSVHMHHTSVLF